MSDERELLRQELMARKHEKPEPEEDTRIGRRIENAIGGTFRSAVSAPAQVLDIPFVPYNLYKAYKGEEGFAPSHQIKKGFDWATNDRYKPTTELGKYAESAADLVSPVAIAKKSAFIAGEGAIKGAKALANKVVPKTVQNAISAAGKTKAGKFYSAVAGKKAMENVLTQPSIGNFVGAGIGQSATGEGTDNPSTMRGIVSGILGTAGTDLLIAAAGKGGRKIKSSYYVSKLKNKETGKSVSEILGTEKLAPLKAEQAKNLAKETRIENRGKELSDNLVLNPKLKKIILKTTDRKAGRSAFNAAKQAKARHEELVNPVYEARDKMHESFNQNNKIHTNDVVSGIENDLKHIQTPYELEQYLKTPKGKIVEDLFNIPAKTALKKKIGIILNPDNKISVFQAKRALDKTSGSKKSREEYTNAEHGAVKKLASQVSEQLKKQMRAFDPETQARVEKTNKLHRVFSEKEKPAINANAQGEFHPVAAYKSLEADTNIDAHQLSIAKTPQVVWNYMRNLGKSKGGSFDEKQMIEKFREKQPHVQKHILESISPEHRKEITRLDKAYRSEMHYNKNVTKRTKPDHAKPYEKDTLEGINTYVEGLSPHHKETTRNIPGVKDALKIENKIDEIKKYYSKSHAKYDSFNPLKWPKKALHALFDAANYLEKDVLHKQAPKIAEEVKHLALRKIDKNIPERAIEAARKIIPKGQPGRIISQAPGSDERIRTKMNQYASTPIVENNEERELLRQELMARRG